jgi:hypothetical protein
MQAEVLRIRRAVELLIHIVYGLSFISYINQSFRLQNGLARHLQAAISCRTIGWSNLVGAKSGVHY